MLLELNATTLYQKNREATARIIANEGGTRSSKTVSLAQLFLTLLFESQGAKLEVVRETMPALKASAMEDFFDQMYALDLYDESHHNKTDHIYRQGRNSIGFFSVDDQQKVRGRKRDYLWINEANELTFQEFNQLAFRTSKQIFLDFNPVDEDHWLFEKVLTRKDCLHIQSSYLDNPFLPPEIIAEIEMLKETDPHYWQVFGLGKRAQRGTKIYQHYTLVDALPENPDELIYGIDFGFNNPSTITKIGCKDLSFTWDELLYKTHLTNSDLIEEMKKLRDAGEITESMQGYADAAEPARIQEINDAGFNVKPADKSVVPGIDFVKGHPLAITKRSINILEEIKKYLWKTNKNGKILDEPVKLNDHSMDGGRYAEYTHFKDLKAGKPNIRIL